MDKIRDTDLSIRFKHGNRTVLLFVSPTKTFDQVQKDLLGALKERYPEGTLESATSSKKTELPDTTSQLRFAVLKDTTDPTQGWKPLKFDADDLPVNKGFQDNMIVAFAIATDDIEAGSPSFEVEFPSYDEEMEDGGE
ncbi:hypothetical protein F4777DRAFT_542482 [Nemania sp. FL0916]|nr:hypothetical protein F4777DRAFT_542482 [Nemania sp. FL0916]